MRRRVASSRDTLQAHRLPPTEYMELNYRPEITGEDGAAAGLSAVTFYATVLFGILWLIGWFGPVLSLALNLVGGTIIGLMVISCLSAQSPHRRFSLPWLVRWIAIALAALAVPYLASRSFHQAEYIFAVAPPLFAVTVIAYLAARQFAFWTTANPQVEWHEVRRWKSIWPRLLSGPIPTECPEILTFRLAIVALLFQFWLGYEVSGHFSRINPFFENQASTGFITLMVVFLPLPFYWIAWNLVGIVPRLPVRLTLNVTSHAWHVWFGYLAMDKGAPGLFRFPDASLRSDGNRVILVMLVVAMLMLSPLLLGDPTQMTSPLALIRGIAEAFPAFIDGDSIYSLMLAGVIAFFLPSIIIFGVTWFVMGSVLTRYWLALEAPGGYGQSQTKSAWAVSVDRIINSRDSLEREHLLLGRSVFGDYPVLLHRDLLHQHAHLLGDSGSRKTSLGIAPLIAQLIAGQDCSVVVLDLKGDRALFETARLEAEWSNADFRWFTSEMDLSSHAFNPIDQSHFARMTPNQQTQLIMEGLALDYGDAYGRGFFSAMNETVLLNLMKRFEIRSFKQLHQFLLDKHANELAGNSEADMKNAKHLIALVARLASISPLNYTKADLSERPLARDASIEMGDVLSRSQVVYFNLKSPAEPIGSPAVAKMAMYALFAAASQRLPDQQHRVYVVIDEFQQVVSENVRLVLEQSRASKLSFIIAHQALGQLDRKGIDVRDTVTACTAFKQIFRASDPDTIRLLETMSGEARFETLSWRQKVGVTTDMDGDDTFTPQSAEENVVMVQETVGSRLERNTIIDISATANTSLISVTEGSGYTQFSGYVTPIISDYHITMKQYDERNNAPWPVPNEETVVVTHPPVGRNGEKPQPTSAATEADDEDSPTTLKMWEARLQGLPDPDGS